jgi:hypothetical protein
MSRQKPGAINTAVLGTAAALRAAGVQVLPITGRQHVVVTTTADHAGDAPRTGRLRGNSDDRHRPVCGGAAGSCTVTQSPPAARGVRLRVPSCAWAMLLTMARPRPTPA